MAMKEITGGVTAAKGFEAAAFAAKIKKEGRDDMALVYSQYPCKAAGTFTTNVVKAAPVKWDRQLIDESAYIQAVIVNSGIANACTGAEGMGYCKQTSEAAGKALGIPAESVLVSSTGVIGMQLPMDRVLIGVEGLAQKKTDTLEAGTQAAKAIMTTDTVHKEFAVEFEVDGKVIHLGGMAKGSGMIHPNMCTMLSYVTTDLNISKEMLTKATKGAVNDSFNMISVDGDTSTNDTFVVLANGAAGNAEITEEGADYQTFKEALDYVCVNLAKRMAGDGEGCTALLEVTMIGCESVEQGKILAKSVVCSSLTKAAMYGHDANWGRILCAMGYSGAQFDPEVVDLWFRSEKGEIKIMENGISTGYSEERATEILTTDAITVIADVKMGDATATAWGCDLTHEYVSINGDYRS